MQNKIKNEPPSQSTVLIVTRDSFKSKLAEQIDQGKSILKNPINNQIDFDGNKKVYNL
jgi:hypothetical protein